VPVHVLLPDRRLLRETLVIETGITARAALDWIAETHADLGWTIVDGAVLVLPRRETAVSGR
jgi:hypothetical protein